MNVRSGQSCEPGLQREPTFGLAIWTTGLDDQYRVLTGVSLRAAERAPLSRFHKAVAQSAAPHPHCCRWQRESLKQVCIGCRHRAAKKAESMHASVSSVFKSERANAWWLDSDIITPSRPSSSAAWATVMAAAMETVLQMVVAWVATVLAMEKVMAFQCSWWFVSSG